MFGAHMSTSSLYSSLRKRAKLFLSLALGCSLALNALQGVRIVQIQTTSTPARHPKGKHLADIPAHDVNGQKTVIHLSLKSSKPKVIYVFSPSCVWCQRNAGHLNELVAHVGSKYDFIGIALSTQGLQQFVSEHELDFPIYGDLSAQALQESGFAGTPETIVVSPDGMVLEWWAGAYEGITKSNIEEYFGCSV